MADMNTIEELKKDITLVFARRDDFFHGYLKKENNTGLFKNTTFVLIKPGNFYRPLGGLIYQVNPLDTNDYGRLISELKKKYRGIRYIVHLWNFECENIDYIYGNNVRDLVGTLNTNISYGWESVLGIENALYRCGLLPGNIKLLYFHFGDGENLQPQDMMVSNPLVDHRSPDYQLDITNILLTERINDFKKLGKIIIKEINRIGKVDMLNIKYNGSGNIEKSIPGDTGHDYPDITVKPDGVYMITDGKGDAGWNLALELIQKYSCKAIVTGDNNIPDEKKKTLHLVNSSGEKLTYVKTGTSNYDTLKELFDRIVRGQYGRINGIIHHQDMWDKGEFKSRLFYTVLLDGLSSGLPLDFFLIISNSQHEDTPDRARLAAAINDFSSSFCTLRSNLARIKKRFGLSRFIILEKNQEKSLSSLLGAPGKNIKKEPVYTIDVKPSFIKPSTNKNKVKDRIKILMENDVIKEISEILKIEAHKIDKDFTFDLDSGDGIHFDSITLTGLANNLSEKFNINLPPVVFFKYKGLDLFIDHILNKFYNIFLDYYKWYLEKEGQGKNHNTLDDKEKKKLLLQWNRTEMEYPSHKCFPGLFDEQAKKTPDFIAAVSSGNSITYKELKHQSAMLAAHLNTIGIGTGNYAGILMDRSLEMLIGILGILKGGGAYIPLDPISPVERLSFIIKDTKLCYMLTDSSNIGGIPHFNGETIILNRDFFKSLEPGNKGKKHDYASQSLPHHIAYIIFTSGSTGKPKGVGIFHRSLVNLLYWMSKKPGFTGRDHLLAVTTICFDMSVPELFLPLLHGGKVEILPGEISKSAAKLKEALDNSAATVMQATPATWQMLIAAGWQGKKSFRVFCGGEALSPDLADSLLEKADAVWNLYGPTEATVYSLMSKLEKGKPVSIGRPVGNTKIYIMDENYHLVPNGKIGELWIGGQGVAKGYLNRPGLTGERFINNPFSNKKNDKIYRTGDNAYYLPDGTVIYTGRSDNQVKLRGYRIELEEIESVFEKTAEISKAVVVLRNEYSDQASLYAFYKMKSSQTIDKESIIAGLKKYLPDYMIPWSFIELSSFPMTLSAKIDRKVLKSSSIKDIKEKFGIEKSMNKETPTFDKAGMDIHRDIIEDRDLDFGEINHASEPIAIIGMFGRFPQSPDPESYFENLVSGKNLITEIPVDRWDYKKYVNDSREDKNKSSFKWGGFIQDVDKFDALFFGISPREAEYMDPRQRLLIESTWKTFEDAGYNPTDFSGTRTGVFIGAIHPDYWDIQRDLEIEIQGYTLSGFTNSIIPNRISYLFNLLGPSEAIDTACSSSLTAVNQALDAIRNDRCEMAVAGGVNLILSPHLYIALNKIGMLCPDGRCKTFDRSANGYARGEGVGTILLKPLSKAIKDNDNIYAVIKGTATGHGGKANSLTAPNPKAQADLLIEAYNNAEVDPGTVTFIETHGTGTELGDPIEIEGLNSAFETLYRKWNKKKPGKPYCGLGAVKTNIGHLEAAAGIAGLIKVVLALKSKKIPGNINFKEINPLLNLKGSPFYIVTESKDWQNPLDDSGHRIPLRAGVSSFGFGGTNAHVVLEEYIHPAGKKMDELITIGKVPGIFILSAKTKESLYEYAGHIHKFINKLEAGNVFETGKVTLTDILFTLQVGRKEMEERLAFAVKSIEELKKKLRVFIDNQAGSEISTGTASPGQKKFHDIFEGKAGTAYFDSLIKEREYSKLAGLWVSGVKIDWRRLYEHISPTRVSMPTYPFAGERYWLPRGDTAAVGKTTSPVNVGAIHPLLHQNTSDFLEQRFSSTFTGREFFLADHVVKGQRVLPGVVYLEMARAAVEKAVGDQEEGRTGIRLKNVAWIQPIVVGDEAVQVHIGLFPGDNGEIDFKIYSGAEDVGAKPVVHSQGTAVLTPVAEAPSLDLPALQSQCNQSSFNFTRFYEAFRAVEINYGPGHQGVKAVYVGSGKVLAELSLPAVVSDTKDQFVLHPTLLDSALQASMGLMMDTGDNKAIDSQVPIKPVLPFALQELELLSNCTSRMWAVVRYGNGSKAGDKVRKFDIDLCSETGAIYVRMKGFSYRVPESETGWLWPASRMPVFPATPGTPKTGHDTVPVTAQDLLREKAENYFKKLLSSVIKLSANRIETDAPMEKYGIDSIMVMQLTDQLEKSFGSLQKTLFFEYRNIRELTGYFLESHRDRLTELLGIGEKAEDRRQGTEDGRWTESVKSTVSSRGRRRFAAFRPDSPGEKTSGALDIAIIGLSGRYPQAKNIQEFWKNLRDGKDCITEIPPDRWDHSLYYDEDKNKPGKTYGKWGGFLEGVDRFDPLFFNISPREAELMDPQERLFLECVYETLEDAGYTGGGPGLQRDSGLGGNVGVYAGVMYEEYQLYGAQETILGRPIALNGSPSSIANRVSYFFNFNGPSMAVDTMCSSSLTAIHLACQSLQRGECEIAVAGGVNVSIHPNKYLFLAQGKFVSSKGRCESFGQGGDGYVPGEGVGAVLLKPLSKAIVDRDHIYGIIKATAINHGGKTNGYTVPNLNAQANVIGRAFKEAGINPATISYMEAHGTGTSLGDPIEITGLTKIFREYTKENHFCALGSVKSNIGHCESAAGIAGVTKVLLQLKHRRLVPSLHSGELNPNIDFSNTPFVVQQEPAEWKRLEVNIEGETREYPRRAGISSFGAGGSNAHLVIEEYIPKEPVPTPTTIITRVPAIIVLSAKDEKRLREQVQQLLEEVEKREFPDTGLADMTYTLQVGREAMDERLAVMVGSLDELEEKLRDFLESPEGVENLYRGQVKQNKEAFALFEADEDLEKAMDAWIKKGKYAKIADLWVKGLVFDWNKLYDGSPPFRVSLPTYPFARERYWVPGIDTRIAVNTAITPLAASIHPLLHQNTSDLSQQRFTSTFTGREFFLADHVLRGQRVLPAAAYLEMARAAVEQAAGVLEKDQVRIGLKNVVWARPLAVGDQPVRVHIGLFPGDNGEISYEIYSESESREVGAEPVVYSQGTAVLQWTVEGTKTQTLDLPALQADCRQTGFSTGPFYDAFRSIGLDYGPGYRGIEELYVGANRVLAKLSLPVSVSHTREHFILHPGLMDSGLQASIGLMIGAGDLSRIGLLKPALPFALEELEIIDNCTTAMWALARYSDGSAAGEKEKVQKIDIDLCNEQGTICVRMKGFSSRVMEEPPGTPAAIGTLMLQPGWQEQAVTREAEATAPNYVQHPVILCEPKEKWKMRRWEDGKKREAGRLGSEKDGVKIIDLQSQQEEIEERFQSCVAQVFEEIQRIIKAKPKGKVLIQVVAANQGEQHLFSGLSGLLKTARLENPKLFGQMIEVEPGEDWQGIAAKLRENSRCPMDDRIRYHNGKRWVANWSEIEAAREAVHIPWKDQGVYLITGGAGGLGLIFAREIVRQVKDVTLILIGRSALNREKQVQLDELRALAAVIQYKQVDVTQKKAVIGLIQSIKQEFGSLHGIIHSAGVIRDNFILKKTREELQEVLAPKVTGLVNLDQASQELPLDFFLLFSSTSGVLGNIGQADYSAANAFMDAYAGYRNALVASKQRRGQTLAINWPLWKEGGMQVNEETREMMARRTGMIAMKTPTGIRALYQGLASGKHQVIIMEGNLQRMKQQLFSDEKTSPITPTSIKIPETVNRTTTGLDAPHLADKVLADLKQMVSQLLKVKGGDIDSDIKLYEYGFDSITLTEFANKLNREYKLELTPTIFFEYSTLHRIAEYLVEEHWAAFAARLPVQTTSVAPVQEMGERSENKKRPGFARNTALSASIPGTTAPEPVAIIGISGKFPMAGNVNEFWRNLLEGKNCIREIPRDRWDWREYYGDPGKERNKTNIKWGGFIDGIDEFDPLFFGISPGEAELMDPQQRLLMIYVWKAVEDAGYCLQNLWGTQTGIFVGTAASGYGGLISRANLAIEGYSSTGLVPSLGPNRMSYFLNLHGPSEAIETACSSSLVAIHRAMEAIRQGTCEMAIVGGVNTIVTPEFHISFSKAGMLCEDGRCKTFSNQANGYVRGEGVGMLFLKKLKAAEQANDHIYGVIRGSAENHGGRANSLTAPNPSAQAQLLKTAYTKAGIDPRSVGYIETHGTGTELGDPIEINGLKTAFKELYQAAGLPHVTSAHCGLGSVKTNIGHLELAAGAAGVIKVLLQLKHKILVKSLHCDTINPYIQLKDSPFYIVRETKEWRPCQDSSGKDLPRRAGVSSFGFGGANAHVVIEEYIPGDREQPPIAVTTQNPAIIVLSAKDKERLREQAQQLLDAMVSRKPEFSDSNLADIAYTLQVGREAMEYRLAMLVHHREELVRGLMEYLEPGKEIGGSFPIFTGNPGHSEIKRLLSGKVSETVVQVLLAEKNFKKLALHWTQGGTVHWELLHKEETRRRISLPTYPFSKERYWVPYRWIAQQTTAIKELEEQSLRFKIDPGKSNRENVKHYLIEFLSKELKLPTGQIKSGKDFFDYGVDSIAALKLKQGFKEIFQLKITGREILEYPTIESLAAYLAGKTNRETNKKGEKTPGLQIKTRKSTVPVREVEEPVERPLSEGQKGLWILQEFFPQMNAYNVPLAFRIKQDIDITLFKKACRFMLKKHPILGAVIGEHNGVPYQTIPPGKDLYFQQETIDHLKEVEIIPYLREKSKEPFNLETGPLMRIHLFSRSGHDDVVLITLHHIIFDGTSTLLLIKSLKEAYHQYGQGGEPQSLPAETTYFDFVKWEQDMLAGEEGREHLSYWKKQLAGELPLLSLPTDYPRPGVQGFKGDTFEAVLKPALTRKVKVMAETQRMNLSILFLGVFYVFLYRYTGQEDVLVGMPTIGRPQRRFEDVIGYFINMMAVRNRVWGEQTFIDLLDILRLTVADGLDHAAYPFPALVKELKANRVQTFSPLFQVSYTYQNFVKSFSLKDPDNSQESLPIELLEGVHQEGEYDFGLEIFEEKEHFTLNMEYNPDLFDVSTIRRMMGHYIRLVEEIVDNPVLPIVGFSMLTTEEKYQILREWNGAGKEYSRAGFVHQLIEAQSAKTPHAAALVGKEERWKGGRGEDEKNYKLQNTNYKQIGVIYITYRELNERANRLANQLKYLGIEPGTMMGLCLERSPDRIVGLLSILKAGGVYVPLDPGCPKDRLEFILQDACIEVILTQNSTEATRPSILNEKLTIVNLDKQKKAIGRRSKKNPQRGMIPGDPAYVIYTSGSTGRPKGVLITHGSLGYHCRVVKDYYCLTPGDRILQFAPLNVDVSLEQVLPGLMIGATLVLKDKEVWSVEEFRKKVMEHRITIVDVPPVYLHELLLHWSRTPGQAPQKQLQLVIVGGEAISPETVTLWRHSPMKSTRLINAYGPTETTITSTAYEITGETCSSGLSKNIPIGRPLTNTKAYILDRDGNPVPEGVPGELHIGGIKVAPGYLNRPELTAERFKRAVISHSSLVIRKPGSTVNGHLSFVIGSSDRASRSLRLFPNDQCPMTNDRSFKLFTREKEKVPGKKIYMQPCNHASVPSPHSPLYRTGDLARYIPGTDGQIEFLGRIDHQVKIRGFRIEPGEIEALLLEHGGVRECAVIPLENSEGEKQLVAYVIPANEQLTVDLLGSSLEGKLPNHMLPSAYVILDKFPLTPGGKVDRRALPMPGEPVISTGKGFVAPRDHLEKKLARVWAEVLDIPKPGIYDNFFDLGGHSILSVRLMAAIQREFDKELPLSALIQGSCIAEQAKQLRQQSPGSDSGKGFPGEGRGKPWVHPAFSDSPLVCLQPEGDQAPFFCVHPVGGNVLSYIELARQLGNQRPFYGLQSPGSNGGKPLDSIEQMASTYIGFIREIQSHGPYHLGGWSMGGVAAFEMAQQLQRAGENVAFLALIESYTPSTVQFLERSHIKGNKLEELDQEVLLINAFATYLLGAMNPGLPGLLNQQSNKTGELFHRILDLAKQTNHLSVPGMDIKRLRRLFNVFKANIHAMNNYSPKSYNGCITLFCADEETGKEVHRDSTRGWCGLAAGGLFIRNIPANHYSILREPRVKVLAEELRESFP